MRPFILVKSLQYLNFSLFECLLFCRVFVLELFDGIKLAIFDVPALVNMTKAAGANKFSDLIFSPEDGFGPLRRKVIGLFLHMLL